jgi:RNA polymerase sigma factor for flagellar operon FliA
MISRVRRHQAAGGADPPPADSPEILARFESELDLVDLVARQIARTIGSTSVTLDDLRSFGREGLLRASRSFDPERGVPFRRWANLRIKGALYDGIRQWGGLPRRVYRQLRALEAADEVQTAYEEDDASSPPSTPEAADAKLTSYLAGIATAMAVGGATARPPERAVVEGTPEELFGRAELIDFLRRVVATLPEKERTLLERHYFGGETLEEAAASLGLSKSWGSRLHARAIEALTDALRSRGEVP